MPFPRPSGPQSWQILSITGLPGTGAGGAQRVASPNVRVGLGGERRASLVGDCLVVRAGGVRPRSGEPAPSGPPLGPLMRSVEPPRDPGTQGANTGAPAAQRRCSSAPRGSSTQWATAGAPEAPCGKEWWARQEKEPPTKPGWAEPRTTARSQCCVNHPGHHAEQGTRGPRTRKHREAVVDGLRTEVCGPQKQSNDQHNPSTPTTERRRRANGTYCHIQHSPSTPTTGLHETTPAGAPAAAPDRKQRPDATREGKNG